MPTMPSFRTLDYERYAVRLHTESASAKLAPVLPVPQPNGRARPVPVAPFCCSTYASIEATCPTWCRFKQAACYVRAGMTGRMSNTLDAFAAEHQLSGLEIAVQEYDVIKRAFGGRRVPQDGACGGRDLRLHMGGDVASRAAGAVLAVAAGAWQRRGGGAVWSYTHRWASLYELELRPINMLASVETEEDAMLAIDQGWVPAMVVQQHHGRRAFRLANAKFYQALKKWRFIPCPAETTEDVTCVTCRLCLDTKKLRERKMGVSFAVHGQSAGKVSLPVVGS